MSTFKYKNFLSLSLAKNQEEVLNEKINYMTIRHPIITEKATILSNKIKQCLKFM